MTPLERLEKRDAIEWFRQGAFLVDVGEFFHSGSRFYHSTRCAATPIRRELQNSAGIA